MSEYVASDRPRGAVSLSAAIAALRSELTLAWWDGREGSVRFKPAPVELTLQLAVTSAGGAKAGVRWWVVELGGDVSRESVVTHTVKLTLEPLLVDENGQPQELFIDADDVAVSGRGAGDASLDAPG